MKDTATNQLRLIRFEPNGPAGLKPMDLTPYEFHTRPEQQNLHVYFEDEELGMSVGVWDTTPMQEPFGPYPGDEFIHVLEGHFDMMDTVDGSGENVACSKGQSVIFRNGVPVSWKQHDYLKKFYITYTDPRAATPEGLSAKGGIQALDPEFTLTDDDILPDSSVKQREKVLFTNDHGNFEVGCWDSVAFTSEVAPFPYHEFCQVLEGEVTLTDADGARHVFKPGECFFIPAGTPVGWHVLAYLKKYYAALDPSIHPGG
ncbi:cupin domain-containing protein [Aestuariivita boseongensis]|uniref:cupin domain-containing protein n=1 Tax=Aestuariivita boseongensis TaxID=1470562 RepID=UPI0006825AEA|nr:cupin domain-containing protein [Aestuariivita boseongensis]